MAGTRISAEILRHAERTGVKVIAVGDSGQLTAVERGPRPRRQPDADVVLIARDNETREQLVRRRPVRLRERGELSGETFRAQDRSWTVGDRVITRRNDRRLDVDNGTLGAITAYDRARMAVQIKTDNGKHRWLDLHYLAHHVEHAYAITGHSTQGATVDHALIVGRPEAFTRDWAYTALSRARTNTSIHLIADHGPAEHDRLEYAPDRPGREPSDCLQALAHAMRRSSDEPLAAAHLGPIPPDAQPVRTPGNRNVRGRSQLSR